MNLQTVNITVVILGIAILFVQIEVFYLASLLRRVAELQQKIADKLAELYKKTGSR